MTATCFRGKNIEPFHIRFFMLTLLLLPLSAQAQTAPTALAGILDAPGPAVAASFAPSSHGPYPYWNKVLTASTTGSPTTLLTGAPKQSVPIDCSNSPSCDAGLEVGMCLQAIPPSECDLLCEKSGIFCADDFEFRNDGSHHNAGATKACAKGTVVGEVCSQAAGMTGGESGGVKNCDAFVDGVLPDYKSDALRSQYKLIGFCESGQLWDDPHVMTLSGNQFFMHGVGVFDYASIPGVIKTQVHMHMRPNAQVCLPPLHPIQPPLQVYMCPFAPCTSEMMASGECLTFVQAVAIQIQPGQPGAHTLVFKNNALRIDGNDRKVSIAQVQQV